MSPSRNNFETLRRLSSCDMEQPEDEGLRLSLLSDNYQNSDASRAKGKTSLWTGFYIFPWLSTFALTFACVYLGFAQQPQAQLCLTHWSPTEFGKFEVGPASYMCQFEPSSHANWTRSSKALCRSTEGRLFGWCQFRRERHHVQATPWKEPLRRSWP